MKCKLIACTILAAFAASAWAESFDVVVIGSGGTGLSAAITAKEAGSSVVVLEKMPYLGGNTNFASGGLNAAGTKQQLAAGVTNDSPELFYEDTMKGAITGIIRPWCEPLPKMLVFPSNGSWIWAPSSALEPVAAADNR